MENHPKKQPTSKRSPQKADLSITDRPFPKVLYRRLHDLIDETAERLKPDQRPRVLRSAVREAIKRDAVLAPQLLEHDVVQIIAKAFKTHARRQVRIDSLNAKQRQFVDALAGPACGNATRAALLAGYSPTNYHSARTIGWRLLTKAKVNEAISQAQARRRAESNWALDRLIELASSSMANFVTVGSDGQLRLDLQKAQANCAMGQIKDYDVQEVRKAGNGKPAVVEVTLRVHDPVPYLRILAGLHGLLKAGAGSDMSATAQFFESATDPEAPPRAP